jgi:hypothetical protein
MKAELIRKVYRVQEYDDARDLGWCAEISFVKPKTLNIKNAQNDGMEFEKCEFKTSDRSRYSLDDWKFLKKLADEILRLNALESKGE